VIAPFVFLMSVNFKLARFLRLRELFERNVKIFVPVNHLFQITIGILKLKPEGFCPV